MHQEPVRQLKQSPGEGQSHANPENEGKSLAPPAFQLKASDGSDAPPVQRKQSSGGLPGDLVDGFAASTGHDLSDVKVHSNSDKPAQVGALAYAQGNDIHLGSGQEQHLAHEAAHIVQQREGRVQANTNVGGMPVNDQASLESEADSMGAQAAASVQLKKAPVAAETAAGSGAAIQRVVDYNALATQLKTELEEGWGYGADTEDVVTIFEAIPWDNGLQQLGVAYALISPDKSMMEAMREALGESGYREVMERGTGIRVREAGDAVHANTAESGYNLRADASASSTKIGQLDFRALSVTVTGKGTSGDDEFYRIRFSEDDYAAVTAGFDVATLAPSLNSAHEAWVTGQALGMYLSWDAMIAQLAHFDVFTFDKSIEEKITMLRQMSHSSDLPFDEIIGTSGPGYYENQRPDVYNFYQLMKEGKSVQTPNGEIIDIYHFLVGLEAYQSKNRKDKASVSMYGITMNGDVGKSDAASTWAGDLGSAAADCYMRSSDAYEQHLQDTGGSIEAERVDYYFRSRAPMGDLLADIDAWGAYEEVENGTAVTVTELVRNYYGAQSSGAAAFKPKRRKALDNFFAQYGIAPTGGSYDTPANQAILATQIGKFAKVWVQYRNETPWPTYDAAVLQGYSDAMAVRFLAVIEDLVAQTR